MTRQKIERISITLPADVLRLADREAKRLNRPRSWVIADALRRSQSTSERPAAKESVVREPVLSPYGPVAGDLAEGKDRRLRLALSWTPAERLRRAEQLVRLARAVRPRRERNQIVAFETFEEFWQWKRLHRAAGAARK
jgi:hypothetical protein